MSSRNSEDKKPDLTEKKPEIKPKPSKLKEYTATSLAIFVVGGTFLLLCVSLFFPNIDLTTTQGLAAIFGGWVGAVLGFYFGRIPAENAAEVARGAAEDVKTTALRTEKALLDETSVTHETSERKLVEFNDRLQKIIEKLRG